VASEVWRVTTEEACGMMRHCQNSEQRRQTLGNKRRTVQLFTL
jgi:hypothetical protein